MAKYTIINSHMTDDGKLYVECCGKSTDDKPEGVATGSMAVETDTGNVCLYEAESAQWETEFSLKG